MGDDPLQDRASQLETGVSIDFDEPRPESLIDHEIQPKDLKVIAESLGVKVNKSGTDEVARNFLHVEISTLMCG